MLSVPPTSTSRDLPTRMCSAPRMIDWSPEPQAWLAVNAGRSCGIPERTSTCRATFGPPPAWRAQP